MLLNTNDSLLSQGSIAFVTQKSHHNIAKKKRWDSVLKERWKALTKVDDAAVSNCQIDFLSDNAKQP